MARFDFGNESAKRSVSGAVNMTVDGVKFSLKGDVKPDATDSELSDLAHRQEGEISLKYPKFVTASGKIAAPVRKLLPTVVAELMDLHTEANTDKPLKTAVA